MLTKKRRKKSESFDNRKEDKSYSIDYIDEDGDKLVIKLFN